jgi:hypothetical protein
MNVFFVNRKVITTVWGPPKMLFLGHVHYWPKWSFDIMRKRQKVLAVKLDPDETILPLKGIRVLKIPPISKIVK